ncbi:hypothetical protein ACJ41O_012986 [Fusarium nematophilum]
MAEPPPPTQELFFRSYNDASSTTIVLLHGLLSCHLEWEYVVPHLNEYHLIVPDHPQHSQSKHIGPFSLKLAADSVATLIRNHAHSGKAHVVGLSLGGFVTMELIRHHPSLVESAFITGATPFSEWQVRVTQRPTFLHWGLWFILNSGIYRAAEWKSGLKDHSQLKKEMAANNTWDLVHDGYGDIGKWKEDAVKSVAEQDKRILAAAGDQGDNLDGTRELAETFRREGSKDGKESRAVVIRGAVHGWDLQFPELFAEGIRAWVEKQPLPHKFESL